MKLDRKKLVEVAVEAVLISRGYHRYQQHGNWSCAPNVYRRVRREQEAALTAMVRELPEVTYFLGRVEKGDMIVDISPFAEEAPNNAKELYQQLKEMCK